jgi:hypothetical protein
MFTNILGKRILMIAVLTTVSCIVAAASGGGNKKSKSAKANAVSIKKNCSDFSLRSGFQFKGSKINLYQSSQKRPYIQLNSYAMVQQGSKKVAVPYQHKISVAGAQTENQKKYNHVELKVLNIKINNP